MVVVEESDLQTALKKVGYLQEGQTVVSIEPLNEYQAVATLSTGEKYFTEGAECESTGKIYGKIFKIVA